MAGKIQKAGGLVAFIDAEHALDPNWASKLGVNVDDLIVAQPMCGEEALEIVEALVDTSEFRLIIVDSVAALVPRAELEGEMGDAHMGLQARLMSQAMRKLTAKCNISGTTVLFINQIREKLGVMFGSPETTSGGRALKFYSSVRVDIRRREKIEKDKVLVGHRIRLYGAKNKCGTPFKETIISLMYEDGFDEHEDLVEYAIRKGVVDDQTSKGWCALNGNKYRRSDLPFDDVVAALEEYGKSNTNI